MFAGNGTAFIKVKAYEYIEISGEKLWFGSLRNSMDSVLGCEGEELSEDFCENLGDIRLEFSQGKFAAAVIPEGYNVFIDDSFLGSEFNGAVEKLEKYFAPVIKLKNKGSVCCEKLGLICFNRSAGGRLFVCSEEYYNEYSSMLLFMEQCEQKTPMNDV